MVGNWKSVLTDANATGPNGDTQGSETDNTELRTHNQANELLTRDTNGDGQPTTLTPHTYDRAGNLRDQIIGSDSAPTKVIYTHDLWNRLVMVQYHPYIAEDPTTRAEYEYNGLHWRIVKRSDTDLAAPGGQPLDQQRLMYYSASWQLLEERIDANYISSPGEDKRIQYIWGIRGLDDIAYRRVLTEDVSDPNSMGLWVAQTYYHCTDPQFSTLAVLDSTAKVLERMQYDPYGRARWCAPEDMTGNGIVNTLDQVVVNSNYGNIPAPGDIDRDGDVDRTDQGLVSNAYGATHSYGQLSKTDNVLGYCGYVFNAEMSDGGLYIVRYRHYQPDIGRWAERDPRGYLDGSSLFQYALSNPITMIDVLGLFSDLNGDGRLDLLFPDDATSGFSAATKIVAAAGLANEIVLNGETHVRISGTNFFVSANRPAGSGGPPVSTSKLFIYKTSNPKRIYRLDYGPNVQTGGSTNWHWNKTKGLFHVQGLQPDHSVKGFPKATGRVITVFRWAGRASLVTSAGASAWEIYHAEDKARETTIQVSGFAAAVGGAWVGTKVGLKLGAAVGATGAGVGAGPGAIIGSITGGVVGGFVGWWAGSTVSETVYDWFVTPLETETWEVCDPE